MRKIENDHLSVSIKDKGAELSSIYVKDLKREALWQGNTDFWYGQAPILFPIVGELKNGETRINGESFSMRRHGFVRKMTPESINVSGHSASFLFKSNDDTLKQYPFHFEFKAIYSLNGSTIENAFEVTNTGNNSMPFNIGGHPAFALDINNETPIDHYNIVFEKEEKAKHYLINEEGLFTSKTSEVIHHDRIQLTNDIFKNDALIFKDLKSRKVWVENKAGVKIIGVDFEGWPYLGIWSKPKAPYVCIEPWIGCADSVDSDRDFLKKEHLVTLKPKEAKTFKFRITV